jgi:hypothetical protein
MVDNAVNVRIGNGQIRVETLAGQPSRDDGTECTSLFRNGRSLSDFQFRGVDGRGEVRLQSDPRQDNRGEAVIYINDPKGGEEGYTFEVSWNGDNGRGNGGFFGGGNSVPYSNNNNYPNGNNNNNYGGNYDQATNACLDTVRSRIERDYNTTNLTFDQVNTNSVNNNGNNNNGNQNRITGTVRSNNGRRGNNFRYECQVNVRNGNVRNVNVWRN